LTLRRADCAEPHGTHRRCHRNASLHFILLAVIR
jgi:hypothetical protein